MTDQPEFDPRFDPAFQRGFEGTPLVEPIEQRPGSRRNPWVWALWGVAVVCTAVGVVGFAQESVVTLVATTTVTGVLLPLLVKALAPWFLGTGLASLVSVLTISAVRWRPRG